MIGCRAICLLLVSGFVIPSAHGETLSGGRLNYLLQCQGCHRAGGEGSEGSVPDLRPHGLQLLRIPEGRRFFVSVPGSANAPLTDSELAEVLNFIIVDILEDDGGRPDSVPRFTEEEVSEYRSVEIADVDQLRGELIRKVTENQPGRQIHTGDE